MKRITTNAVLLIMALQLGMVSLSSAQKREKSERIIIQKKPGNNEKMVIEIDGNKVKINGKEVKEGDSNVIIREFNDKLAYLHMPQVYERVMPRLHEELRMKHGNLQHLSREFELNREKIERRVEEIKLKMEKHAFLGVSTEEVEKGLKITEVQKESAAAAAGLQEGDIITRVDGKDMKESEQLVEAIRSHKPGDEVNIEYLRDGKKKTAKATLKSIQMPEHFEFRMNPIEVPVFPEFHFEGLGELRELPYQRYDSDGYMFYKRGPKLGATIQDTENGNGVTVEEVDAESPAAKNGLQKGDVITEINGQKISNVADARDAVRDAKDKSVWTIKAERSGKPVTIEVKIPKELKKTELKP